MYSLRWDSPFTFQIELVGGILTEEDSDSGGKESKTSDVVVRNDGLGRGKYYLVNERIGLIT